MNESDYSWNMEYLEFIILALFGLILWLFHPLATIKCLKNKRNAPPQPTGARPLIGHLHLLDGNKLIHRILSDMAENVGPIFTLRLGFHKTIVVSSWEVAKECFTTNDKTFATRPESLALRLMAYNQSVLGFAPYGPYWRSMRRFVVLHLLTSRRLHMLRHVRFSEIGFFMKSLYQQWEDNKNKNRGNGPVLVEMKDRFEDMTTNIIVRIIAGKGYNGSTKEEPKQCQKALGEFLRLSGRFFISDAIPFLGWLDILNGNCAEMKRAAKEADIVFSRWLKEHKEKRRIGPISDEDNDLIHVMLSELDEGELASIGYDIDTTIKSTCMSMILGGNDTTSITMSWALSFLLNNREVMSKIYEELDMHVGRDRQVEETDITNLVYLQAVIKESMRLQPILPLLITHEAMEDCHMAGFEVSAGTRLLVNVWKIHRDPSVWSDPLEFKPERFLGQEKNIDYKGKDFEFLPFGSGRRICPGITFSQQVMHLGMARFLQGFEVDTIDGLSVDMTERPGLSVPKDTPLKVFLRPRLSHALYA